MHERAVTLDSLRAHAIAHALFPPTTLAAAIRRLGFVQADPIRAPAIAQDLILRHRVRGYRAGDVERRYASLEIEEDYLYAYGFFPRDAAELLHPRRSVALSKLEKKVLDAVRAAGVTHPKELEKDFGRKRVVNAWGGHSKATTSALDALHHLGHLRIARRENGVRLYEVCETRKALAPQIRLRKLILLIAGVLAPIADRALHTNLARYRHLGDARRAVRDLLASGELESGSAAGLTYLWPVQTHTGDAPEVVRFLAPFDPLVWDRRRFEHLFGWPYRFEAYTPATKRIRGYYALPLLWRDRVIGWANASAAGGSLRVEVGFAGKRPRDAAFRRELEAETGRMNAFLR